MIDIETLDTSREAKILSIGAVKFDTVNGIHEDRFYKEVDTESGPNKDRKESQDTIDWWKRQDAPYSMHPNVMLAVTRCDLFVSTQTQRLGSH